MEAHRDYGVPSTNWLCISASTIPKGVLPYYLQLQYRRHSAQSEYRVDIT